jgi:peptidyl-prolyl cis-trans isomerase D
MAKESSTKSPKTLTKKHLARIEKEKRQNRILTIGIITIIAAIAILVLFAMFSTQINKFFKETFTDSRPVAKIGDTTITVKQFDDRVSYERYQLVSTFTTYASSYFASFFQSQLLQVQNELDNYVQFGSDTLDKMIGEQALILKAKEMGITVTDAEVEKEIEENLSYFPNGTPTATLASPTITYYPTNTLSSIQNTLTYKTPTAIPPSETPTITETPGAGTPTAGPLGTTTVEPTLPTETVVPTATVNLTPTETETPAPTATVYTKAGYDAFYSTIVANLSTNAGFSDQELREYVRTVLYERKVFAEVSKTVAVEQDMVWARHILVADEATANEVLAKLKAGGDWNALAAQYSTDTSNNTTGGDLGWFAKGTMVSAFETSAWALKVGEISAPIKTDYGYHIIQVLGHEKRQLTADELSTAQNAAYQKFIDDAKTEFIVTKYDIWASNVPTTPAIPDSLRISASATVAPN